MMPLRILTLSKYGRQGASSRMRTFQYFPYWKEMKWTIKASPLICDNALSVRYKDGRHNKKQTLKAYIERARLLISSAKDYDLIWIEKEAFPWLPYFLEQSLINKTPYVLDYDDAIFHNYDLHRSKLVRQIYGEKLDQLMQQAALVVCGNRYLADRARNAGANQVVEIPTVIDLERYPCIDFESTAQNDIPRIVWIGSPSTAKYLEILAEPLRALAERIPFILRLVGSGNKEIPGVRTEIMNWSEECEVELIRSSTIGIMPLADSPWERGKCGYKLIQYMACGLPTVASDVGANADVMVHGQTGFLAKSPHEWLSSLQALLENSTLRERMGSAGRARVERFYCIQKTAPQLGEILNRVVMDSSR